jgi:hypothetical protein
VALKKKASTGSNRLRKGRLFHKVYFYAALVLESAP